jgi:PAS domain-containing protein
LVISLLTEALRSTRQRANASTLEARSHLERLRQSEKLYRTVVEQAAENIFLVDAETKRILEGNAAFYASLGYRSQQLKRMTLYTLGVNCDLTIPTSRRRPAGDDRVDR